MSGTTRLNAKNQRKCFEIARAAGFEPTHAACLRGPVAEVSVVGHRDILVDYKAGTYLGVSPTLGELMDEERAKAVANWRAAGASEDDIAEMADKLFPAYKRNV